MAAMAAAMRQPPTPLRRADVLGMARRIAPPMTHDAHKGQGGRVGVLGGSGDYTGAPFFAAMAALRCGADLAYVFCAPSAAAAIKV